MHISLRNFVALAAMGAVANAECSGEETCIREQRSCTGKEDQCCEGYDCFGYRYFKKCQAPPACLPEWYDCKGLMGETGEDPCCPGFVCADGLYADHKQLGCVREETLIGSRTTELPGLNTENYIKEPPKPLVNCETTKSDAEPGHYKACLSGDPHITTFNQLNYDCQGVGEFVLFKSKEKTRRMVQGRFTRVVRDRNGEELDASSMHGVVIQDEGCKEVPKVQLTIPQADGEGGISTPVGSKGCKLQLFINDAIYDLNKPYEDDHLVVEKHGSETRIHYKESGFRASVTMGYWNGCLLNACFDVPKGDEYIGLLGHARPGGEALTDWVTRDGKALEVPAREKANDRLKEPGYNYCTKHWCMWGEEGETMSLFKYNEVGYDFGFYSRCNLKYRTSLLEFIDDLDQEILDFCEMDLFCLMDALDGGLPAARQARFNRLEMKEGTECGKEEATCAGGCCDGFECVRDDGPEPLCMPIKREKKKCKKRPLSKCTDTKPCCEGMECLNGRCRPLDQECVPEEERVFEGVTTCCNGLKPFGRGKRKVCKKLKDKSQENEPCDKEQLCGPGLFCKRGNCKKIPQQRAWGEGCNEFDEDDLDLGCDGKLKCAPWKERKVCQDLGVCGKKYARNCDLNPCCPEFECVTEKCEVTGKMVSQCQPKGQKEAREKRQKDKQKTSKETKNTDKSTKQSKSDKSAKDNSKSASNKSTKQTDKSGKSTKQSGSDKSQKQTDKSGKSIKESGASATDKSQKQTDKSGKSTKQSGATDKSRKQTDKSSKSNKQSGASDKSQKQTDKSGKSTKQSGASDKSPKQTDKSGKSNKQSGASNKSQKQTDKSGKSTKQSNDNKSQKQTDKSGKPNKQSGASAKSKKQTDKSGKPNKKSGASDKPKKQTDKSGKSSSKKQTMKSGKKDSKKKSRRLLVGAASPSVRRQTPRYWW